MITGYDIHHYLGIGEVSCPGFYVGFNEINGVRAPTKTGVSANARAVQRGRAQGGANWWFESYFMLPSNVDTKEVKKEWTRQMKSQNIKVKKDYIWSYAPVELYQLSPRDATNELEALLISMDYETRDIVKEISHPAS